MKTFEYVTGLFEAKGWHLYRGMPGAGLGALISQGRAKSLELGNFYHILPQAFRDTDSKELQEHMEYAARSCQVPTYNDKTNPSAPLGGIYLTENGVISFVLAGESAGYEFEAPDAIQRVIKYNISNYNIYYFKSIDEIKQYFADQKVAPQRPSVLPAQLRWTLVQRSEDPAKRIIYPEEPSHILFRGQNKRYHPCNPSCLRGFKNTARSVSDLDTNEKARLIVNLIKTQWFKECLEETPVVKWMNQEKIYIDTNALAQHYGLPTGFLDLSQSLDVASFFACCKYDQAIKAWKATTEADGEGVIYVVDRNLFPMDGPVKPIGLQPFPRPSEQWGWGYEVRLGDDFDKLPEVKKFVFKHDQSKSENILSMFKGGDELFPPDALATVADRVNASAAVPRAVARNVIQDIIDDSQGLPNANLNEVIEMIVKETGIIISDTAIVVMDNEIRGELNKTWQQRRGVFANSSGVGLRLVRLPKEN